MERSFVRVSSRSFAVYALAWFLAALLCPAAAARAQSRMSPVSPARVLVVENTQSPDSVAIADYYMSRRHVPASNRCRVACPTVEECSMQAYQTQIMGPIKAFLAKTKLDVDFIVLTKGIPIRTKEGPQGGYGVDSLLATMDWSLIDNRTVNPYFGKAERFTHKKFNLYLVTRLIGYTRGDCLRLVDNSLIARPTRGPFLFDLCPDRDNGGYRMFNDDMRHAIRNLNLQSYQVIVDEKGSFASSVKGLMGYYSWGSNDTGFNKAGYRGMGFLPGALAETAVSSSGRTFADPSAPGQSLIADLIAQGVTGCKGYVSEPYIDSMARAFILFDRYTRGFTLAESFYMASQWVHWKDMVIGDPLCAPYTGTP